MRAAIVGATGYGGAELIRLLYNHPEVELSSIHSSSQKGTSIIESYPHLYDLESKALEEIDPVLMKQKADVVFLSTPPGISAKITPLLLEQGLSVIDLSGDLRLKDPEQYKKWYHLKPADDEIIMQSVYGLSEWARHQLKGAQLISNPGCYPTASLLGLGPVINEKVIETNSIIIDAKSGVSGAGRSPMPISHFSEMTNNFKIYKVNEHKHIPEIEQTLQQWDEEVTRVTVSTHLVPMTRGIMTTIYANAKEPMTEKQLRDLYMEVYSRSPFVRVREEGVYPATKEVHGTNYCDIGITFDERTGRITIVSVIDNLMKGAAGQAIQNLNLAMGIDETAGLQYIPIYP
ncbi:N-acetyl-gamma-glutamyl-phosphate reductase [Evansella halocellulosilytica]|uniref:N-acetyl-gamma-glutamyl-phosphate reductase n=1 Tax=Evansella halocellulosilytica TaxID=2011013 RepID=UPI000BB896FB|nr:N-acetyl-gamma-glutamyl-phosphate reductase [Evansella halocellulosilytica]